MFGGDPPSPEQGRQREQAEIAANSLSSSLSLFS